MTVNIIQHATDEADWYEADGITPTTALGVPSLLLTLLTLDRARQELRVPPGDTGQDELIRNLIKSAVSFVQDDLNIPLLQEQVYTVLHHVRTNAPITFGVPGDKFVQKVVKVRYQVDSVDMYIPGEWPKEIQVHDNLDEPVPDEEAEQIAPGLGDGDQIAGNVVIKPPGGQWPAAAGNQYVVHYERGIKNTRSDLDTIRQIVILKLRDLFYGTAFMKGSESNTAYERLAKIVRFLGITHTLYRIS